MFGFFDRLSIRLTSFLIRRMGSYFPIRSCLNVSSESFGWHFQHHRIANTSFVLIFGTHLSPKNPSRPNSMRHDKCVVALLQQCFLKRYHCKALVRSSDVMLDNPTFGWEATAVVAVVVAIAATVSTLRSVESE